MAKIAFLGLGQMGAPMARRLLQAGHLRLVAEAAAATRDLKVTAAARAWLDSAVESGAADLDFSAVVATILGEEPQV